MGSEFGKDQLKSSAYTFAGLAMMLNIHLVYSDAQYALLRFKLPENQFNIFLGNMGGAIKFWCLVSMVIANALDFERKRLSEEIRTKMDSVFRYKSIFWHWANFSIFVILLIVFVTGGDQGNVTAFYWVISASGFVFGINMVMVFAMEWQYLSWYMIGENSLPMIASFLHYVGTLFFGKRRNYNFHYNIVVFDITISLIFALVAAVLWTCGYLRGENDMDELPSDCKQKNCTRIELKLGLSQLNEEYVLVLASELTDEPSKNLIKSHKNDPYLAILQYEQVSNREEKHKSGCDGQKSGTYYTHFTSPSLMVIVGIALVYAIYPSIAPGIIVPFDLIDKIEMALMIATIFPPVTIAILKQSNPDFNPYITKGNWGYEHEKVKAGTSKNISFSSKASFSVTMKLTGIKITGRTFTISYKDTVGITLTIKPMNGSQVDICIAATHELKPSGNEIVGNAIKYNAIILINLKLKDTDTGKVETANLIPISIPKYSLTEGVSNSITISTIYSVLRGKVNCDLDEIHDNHKNTKCCFNGKVWNLKDNPSLWWNSFIILVPLKISIFVILIYSLHYRESNLSRFIIDKPIMSTILTITFYMCHKILLAVGYPGIATDEHVLLPIQLIAVIFMVFLEFYSVGYINEYKKYDPDNWPTYGMKGWEAFCFWCKSASKNTNANLKALFTKDLRRDLEFLETKNIM